MAITNNPTDSNIYLSQTSFMKLNSNIFTEVKRTFRTCSCRNPNIYTFNQQNKICKSMLILANLIRNILTGKSDILDVHTVYKYRNNH